MMELIINILNKFVERKSYVVLLACFGFIVGIIGHSFIDIKFDFFWIYNFLLFFTFLISFFWNNKKIRLVLLGVFFIVLGFARFNLGMEEKFLSNFWNKDVEIVGVIADEPADKIDKQQLFLRPAVIDNLQYDGRERILITTNLYPKYKYGDVLEIKCKLSEPVIFDDFDYARYLSIQNIYGVCYWPIITSLRGDSPMIQSDKEQVELDSEIAMPSASLQARNDSFYVRVMIGILNFKNFLISKINIYLHEPEASFLSGLIVGARNAIPPSLSDNFKRTGTTHIIAISGWNITFLGRIFLPILFLFHIRRSRAFYVLSSVIILYVFLTGAGASVVRAAIMGIIALWAEASGRYSHAGRALLYSIVLMFLINASIVFDVGFYLSVAATFGLIYFSQIIGLYLDKIKLKNRFIKENLQTTISAIVYTLPVSMFVFGSISLWALPVNIIILPFIATAIVFGLIVLPGAILIKNIFIVKLLFLPNVAILNFIIKVISVFGSLPFGYLNFKINFWLMLALYLGILYFTFYKYHKMYERF